MWHREHRDAAAFWREYPAPSEEGDRVVRRFRGVLHKFGQISEVSNLPVLPPAIYYGFAPLCLQVVWQFLNDWLHVRWMVYYCHVHDCFHGVVAFGEEEREAL